MIGPKDQLRVASAEERRQPPGEGDLDIVGFSRLYKCAYCDAALYWSNGPPARYICLNACELPAWQYRLMQQGLAKAARSVYADTDRKDQEQTR